jgi:hypothetical protein
MPLRTKDMPGPDFVEQATAAPGEKRAVAPPAPPELCGKPVKGSHHPCDREAGHKGKHSYRGE